MCSCIISLQARTDCSLSVCIVLQRRILLRYAVEIFKKHPVLARFLNVLTPLGADSRSADSADSVLLRPARCQWGWSPYWVKLRPHRLLGECTWSTVSLSSKGQDGAHSGRREKIGCARHPNPFHPPLRIIWCITIPTRLLPTIRRHLNRSRGRCHFLFIFQLKVTFRVTSWLVLLMRFGFVTDSTRYVPSTPHHPSIPPTITTTFPPAVSPQLRSWERCQTPAATDQIMQDPLP